MTDYNTIDIQQPAWAPDRVATKGHKPTTTGKQDMAIVAFWFTLPIWVKGLALLLAL